MSQSWKNGNFDTIPLPRIFFLIWESKNSGTLIIETGKRKKRISFKSGDIPAYATMVDPKSFLKFIKQKNITKKPTLAIDHMEQNCGPAAFIKSFTEQNIIEPSSLWDLLEIHIRDQIYKLFNQVKEEYIFTSDILPEEDMLFSLPTLDLILKGIYSVESQDTIRKYMPPEHEVICSIPPQILSYLRLSPHEKYIVNMIKEHRNLKKVYEKSLLGSDQTQKIVFAFLCMDLIRPESEEKSNINNSTDLPLDLGKILDAFNDKSSFILKYISKEIGPVASSLIEKCVEDTRPHLSSLTQNLTLEKDGRFNFKGIMRNTPRPQNQEYIRTLLQDLDELLAAEVLAIKKNLGNQHEKEIVQNLNKIGKWQ